MAVHDSQLYTHVARTAGSHALLPEQLVELVLRGGEGREKTPLQLLERLHHHVDVGGHGGEDGEHYVSHDAVLLVKPLIDELLVGERAACALP